jgi:hypothetical protein
MEISPGVVSAEIRPPFALNEMIIPMTKYYVTIQISDVDAEDEYVAQRTVVQAMARLKIAKTQHWGVIMSSAGNMETMHGDINDLHNRLRVQDGVCGCCGRLEDYCRCTPDLIDKWIEEQYMPIRLSVGQPHTYIPDPPVPD